jgi:hypothetical protein
MCKLKTVLIITQDEDGKFGLFESVDTEINLHRPNPIRPIKTIVSNYLEFENYLTNLKPALKDAEESGNKKEADRLAEVFSKLIRFRNANYAIPASMAILTAIEDKSVRGEGERTPPSPAKTGNILEKGGCLN